ncbi:MAG TPA: thioredoxin [Gammaproteobacteria bacterium]|nr:thioredoxin [Gammaproteobacteria bacterium]
MENPKTALLSVGEGDFERLVLDSAQPAVVDFSAAWCGPCRSIAPVIEGLANDYADRVTVATVDIDDNPRLAAKYGVRSVPTVMLFAGGDVKRVLVGARSAQEYRSSVDELLH